MFHLEEERLKKDAPGIEVNEVLNTIFQYLTLKDIIRVSRVSQAFRRVATNDILFQMLMNERRTLVLSNENGREEMINWNWNEKSLEFDAESSLYESFFGLIKNEQTRKDDIYRDKIRREKQLRYNQKFKSYVELLIIPLVFMVGMTSFISPVCGIYVQGIGAKLIVEFERNHELRMDDSFTATMMIMDAIFGPIFGVFCSLCGVGSVCCCLEFIFSCCFCCCSPVCCACMVISTCCSCCCNLLGQFFFSPNYAQCHAIFWLGKYAVPDSVHLPMETLAGIMFITFFPLLLPIVAIYAICFRRIM